MDDARPWNGFREELYNNLHARFDSVRTDYQGRTLRGKVYFWVGHLSYFLPPLGLLLIMFSHLPSAMPIGNLQTFTLDFTTGYHVITGMTNESFKGQPLRQAKFILGDYGLVPLDLPFSGYGDTHYEALFGSQGGELEVIHRAPSNEIPSDPFSGPSTSVVLGEQVTHLVSTYIYPPWTNKLKIHLARPAKLSACLIVPGSPRGNRLSVRRLLKDGWVINMNGTSFSDPRTKEQEKKQDWATKVGQGRGSGQSGMGIRIVLRHRMSLLEIRPDWVVTGPGRAEWQVTFIVPDHAVWGNRLSRAWSRATRFTWQM
ncbi:uncharacterized protein KY384_002859 [Bacidia gigantensis]|uniref:uncharacterized protein n=1 Tax=Bacidia gigantensis TaxID=2732470 RepID=UPI001D04C0BB|nr:uncharacterized protein KY384_002859 [Bacidia gigantensis]KAG8532374.1 hypothetical protein KY384_002859 [Bacidia gigantensis]